MDPARTKMGMRSSGAAAEMRPAGGGTARPVVVPLGRGGQIDGARALLVLGDGGDEEGGAEHVLVGQLAGGAVGGEVHDERAHHGVAGLGGPAGQRVDVGEEGVAQAVEAELGVEGGGVVAEGPHLARAEFAVDAQERGKGGVLEPAGVQLAPLVLGVGRHGLLGELALHGVAAGVHGPVGEAGDAGAEAGGDLLGHGGPCGGDVARPGDGGGRAAGPRSRSG